MKAGSSQGQSKIVDCWVCDDVFIGFEDLKNHMVNVHNIEPVLEEATSAKTTPAKATSAKTTSATTAPAKATPAKTTTANDDLNFYGGADDDHIARNEQIHEDWLAKNTNCRRQTTENVENSSNQEISSNQQNSGNKENPSNQTVSENQVAASSSCTET